MFDDGQMVGWSVLNTLPPSRNENKFLSIYNILLYIDKLSNSSEEGAKKKLTIRLSDHTHSFHDILQSAICLTKTT